MYKYIVLIFIILDIYNLHIGEFADLFIPITDFS